MQYFQAVQSAPPGAAEFRPEDLARLSRGMLRTLLGPGPAAIPLEDVAAALQGTPALEQVEAALEPARASDLRALASSGAGPRRQGARARVVRGGFWLLVYELMPERWAALARSEPIAPAVVDALPPASKVLEICAGSGRLTALLAPRCEGLVAIEPSPPLRRMLASCLPGIRVVAGLAHRLPVVSGWADLVVSCASLGPDHPFGGPQVLAEMERCVRPGGMVALVGPESPAWFEARGYQRRSYGVEGLPTTAPPEVAAFFGPRLSPPHELLFKVA